VRRGGAGRLAGSGGTAHLTMNAIRCSPPAPAATPGALTACAQLAARPAQPMPGAHWARGGRALRLWSHVPQPRAHAWRCRPSEAGQSVPARGRHCVQSCGGQPCWWGRRRALALRGVSARVRTGCACSVLGLLETEKTDGLGSGAGLAGRGRGE
jgi:hypothetical protein